MSRPLNLTYVQWGAKILSKTWDTYGVLLWILIIVQDLGKEFFLKEGGHLIENFLELCWKLSQSVLMYSHKLLGSVTLECP
jgi:hypothetical protein